MIKTNPAKVLLVTSSFLPGKGGIESYLAELCQQVSPELAVIAQAKRGNLKLPNNLDYQTFPLARQLPWPGRQNLAAIVDVANQLKTKKIFFGTPWPLSMYGPELKKRGFNYIVLSHAAEFLIPFHVPFLGQQLARSLSEADHLFTVSNFTANKIRQALMQRGLSMPNITRLPPRVDTNTFRPNLDATSLRKHLGIAPEAKIILFLSRWVKRKGAQRLIAAMPQIRAQVPNAVAVIAGSGPHDKQLRQLAARTPGVVIAGRLSVQDSPQAYATADVFALPVVDGILGLETEGLGIVLLEAEASGTPVVSGVSGGTIEALVDKQTGFLIDARSQDQLIDRLVWLLTHDSERKAMGRAGRHFVQTEFAHQLPPQEFLDWIRS